jgi:hypothetical protein
MPKPFVYVSGLMRTGTTLMQEQLTSLPYSFIFHEPRLGEGKFDIKDRFLEGLPDIKAAMGRERNASSFKRNALPLLYADIEQIGVKEIHPQGWESYAEEFPDMRVVILGRDPRDHFISIYNWIHKRGVRRKLFRRQPFTVDNVYQGMRSDFREQRKMAKFCNCIMVKYEDFVSSEDEINRIKDFVDSPIPRDTKYDSSFLSSYERRSNEYKFHGGEVTNRSVGRWKTEERVKGFEEYYERMGEYRDFWGY